MTRDEAHELIDRMFDADGRDVRADEAAAAVMGADTPARKLPEGKRAVRTKAQGDRVYLIDETKKTRQWVTTPEVLKSYGFEMNDVVEVEDAELIKYQMSSALYRAADATA